MSFFRSINRTDALILFAGDIVILYGSLFLSLLIRQLGFAFPEFLGVHIQSFTWLIAVWVIVFFIAGLYEKHTVILKSRLPSIILNAQIVNSVIAVLFFYFIPYFEIAPKTVLFIYLVVSFGLILLWRLTVFPRLRTRKRQTAILIGRGGEMHELFQEVNGNKRYGLYFAASIDLDQLEGIDFRSDVIDRVYAERIGTIVVDTRSDEIEPLLPHLYDLIFSGVRFIDKQRVYEDIFDREPLSLVKYSWFLENISTSSKFAYDVGKRAMDILLASGGLAISLVLYPFVLAAVKLDDGGALFIVQERVGKSNRRVNIIKFRSMRRDDKGNERLQSTNEVTAVGAFLRRTRIDELPQLINVLKGDLSLIGPRPEFPELVERYEKEVPFYNVRHLVKPGLTGWGQIKDLDVPRGSLDVERTKRKLSYDLYYIKNRSFLLDLKIVLKTLKTLLSRSGT